MVRGVWGVWRAHRDGNRDGRYFKHLRVTTTDRDGNQDANRDSCNYNGLAMTATDRDGQHC